MSNQAFFYINGEPTNGKWIDLDIADSTDDVLADLAAAGIIPKDEDGEPVYGGDLLVADSEGLAREFHHTRSDTFDFDGFIDARDYCDTNHVDEDAVAAYINQVGAWGRTNFEDAFCGKYPSEEDYAAELFGECYASEIPENLRGYIDYKAFARDLFMGDYFYADGYVFRSN